MPDSLKPEAPRSLDDAVASEKNFVHFDLNLSATDNAALQALAVGKQDSYDNFGADERLKPEAARFFQSLGNTPEVSAQSADIVEKLVKDTLAAFGAEAAWVTIRAFQPGDAYDIPRWHRDGYFYEPHTGDQRKVAVALKGTATLFNDMPEGLRREFNERARSFDRDDREARLKIAEMVDAKLTETAGAGQGSVFVVGSDRAAVHSEPPIHSDRVFVSVMPGTKAQIEELRQRWQRNSSTYAKTPDAPAQK